MPQEQTISFLAINKDTLVVHRFLTANGVACFLWGKESKDYIIVKGDVKVVRPTKVNITDVEEELENA